MTHAQTIWLTLLIASVGVIWTCFWLWISWMAFRVLRWTYLEKKSSRAVLTVSELATLSRRG
jgi:hypothetical protein